MTITPLSPPSITAFARHRHLSGTGDASPTATISAAFGRQNLGHRVPDHRPDRIQGGQNRLPQRQSGGMAGIVKGFRMPASQRAEGLHGGRRPKSLEGGTAGEFAPTLVSVYGEFAGAA